MYNDATINWLLTRILSLDDGKEDNLVQEFYSGGFEGHRSNGIVWLNPIL